MTLSVKWKKLAAELREDGTLGQQAFRLAQRGSRALHLSPAVSLERCVLVEIEHPPAVTRGLSDLVVRRVEESDLPAVSAIDGRDPALFRGRLARGELLYLGELDGEVICHTCLHRGPTAFTDEREMFAAWALEDASTFWSYDASVTPAFRTAGVAAKVFQLSLREVFALHGARRVRGFIHTWNEPSLSLHERLGFSVLGKVTAVALPGLKWVRWESGGHSRQWVLPRNSDFALPPVTT